jgi:uncharacterized protein YlxW (UPF0749 family)
MKTSSVIIAFWSTLLILTTILNGSQAYVTSLTARKDHRRKASNVRHLQKMRRMKARLEKELQTRDAFQKKVEYFKRWLRKFERKVNRNVYI